MPLPVARPRRPSPPPPPECPCRYGSSGGGVIVPVFLVTRRGLGLGGLVPHPPSIHAPDRSPDGAAAAAAARRAARQGQCSLLSPITTRSMVNSIPNKLACFMGFAVASTPSWLLLLLGSVAERGKSFTTPVPTRRRAFRCTFKRKRRLPVLDLSSNPSRYILLSAGLCAMFRRWGSGLV